MTVREPSNETHLAAELASAPANSFSRPSAFQAARVAHELCRIGRAYKRGEEKSCGGEEEWGPWSGDVERRQARLLRRQNERLRQAQELLTDWHGYAVIEVGDLHFGVRSGPYYTACL